MYDYDDEINQILKNSGTKLLEDDDYDHHFDKYRKLFKQMMSKDWTCKIYAKQRGANDKEFKRLLNEFCDTIELENFEITGKDAGVSWVKINDIYFDDDSIFEEWKEFVDNNINPTIYSDYTDGSDTEIDESILKEDNNDYAQNQDFLPEGIKEISNIISNINFNDIYGWNESIRIKNAVIQICNLIYDGYNNSYSDEDPYYFLWNKLDDITDEYINELKNEALNDDDNRQERLPEGDEIDWDQITDKFYSDWSDDPIYLINNYYGYDVEDILSGIKDICEDYLIKNKIIKSDENDENEYSGDDTELDESYYDDFDEDDDYYKDNDLIVDIHNLSDIDKKIYNIYADIKYNLQELNSTELDNYFINHIRELEYLDDFDDIPNYINEQVLDDMRESYTEDTDNWEMVYDEDATLNYVDEHYSDSDLINSYSYDSQNIRFIKHVQEEIDESTGLFSLNKAINYNGSDTELDESIESKNINEEFDRPFLKLLKKYEKTKSNNDLIKIYDYCIDNTSLSYYYQKELYYRSNAFRDKLEENAYDDYEIYQYRRPEWDEVDEDILDDNFDEDFEKSFSFLIKKYTNETPENFVKTVDDYVNEYSLLNKEIDYEGNDTQLDESSSSYSFNGKIFEIRKLLDEIIRDKDWLNNKKIYNIYVLTEYIPYTPLTSYVDDLRNECYDNYRNDPDNWGNEVYDADATRDYINSMSMKNILDYATKDDIDEYYNDIRKTFLYYINNNGIYYNYGYNGDDTQLDESSEQNLIINDSIKKIADLCDRINDSTMLSTLRALCKQLFPIVYQEIDMNDNLGGKLFNIASKFYDYVLFDRASEDNSNRIYRIRDIEEVDLDDLDNNFNYCFNNNTDYCIRKYGQGVIDFYNGLIEIFEEEFNDNLEINYEGDDTQLDESFDKSTLKQIYDILKFKKTDSQSLERVIDFCNASENPRINDYLSDIYNDCLYGYRNDPDNWGEEVDVDATDEAIANMPYDEMIEYYTDRDDIKDFSSDITEELLNYYNVDALKEIYSKEFIPNEIYSGNDTELDESVLLETEQNLPNVPDDIKEIVRLCLEIDQYDMLRHLEDSVYDLYEELKGFNRTHRYDNNSELGRLRSKFENICEKFFNYLIECAQDDESNFVRRKPTEDDVDFNELNKEFVKYFRENPGFYINKYCSDSCPEVIRNILNIIEDNDLLNNKNIDNIIDEDINYDSDIGIIYELCEKLDGNITNENLYTLIEIGRNCSNPEIREYVNDVYDETSSGFKDDENNWGDDIVDYDETFDAITQFSTKELIKYYASSWNIKNFGTNVLDIVQEYYGLETSQLEDLFNDEKEDIESQKEDTETQKVDIEKGDIYKDKDGNEYEVTSYDDDHDSVWLINIKNGSTMVASSTSLKKWFEKLPNKNTDGTKRPQYNGDYTELDESIDHELLNDEGKILYTLEQDIIDLLSASNRENLYEMKVNTSCICQNLESLKNNDSYAVKRIREKTNDLISTLAELAFEDSLNRLSNRFSRDEIKEMVKNQYTDGQLIYNYSTYDLLNHYCESIHRYVEEIEKELEVLQYDNSYNGDDTELDESLLKENNDDDEFKNAINEIRTLIDKFYSIQYNGKEQVVASIMDKACQIFHYAKNESEKRIAILLNDEYSELKDKCIEGAADDDSNAQYRRLEYSEINWDEFSDGFYKKFDYSPSDMVSKYFSGGKELIIDNMIEICKEYLKEKGYNLDIDKNEYSGDDTELDESLLKETENAEEFDDQIFDLYKELMELWDSGHISDNKFDYYIKQVLNNYYDFEKLYDYIHDEVIDEIKDGYDNDEDNWPEEYDSEATNEYCYNNYTNEELLEYYVPERFMNNFVKNVEEIINNNYIIDNPNDKKSFSSYNGDDTQLDESVEEDEENNTKLLNDLLQNITEFEKVSKQSDSLSVRKMEYFAKQCAKEIEKLYLEVGVVERLKHYNNSLISTLRTKAFDQFSHLQTIEGYSAEDLMDLIKKEYMLSELITQFSTWGVLYSYCNILSKEKGAIESRLLEKDRKHLIYSGDDTELDESEEYRPFILPDPSYKQFHDFFRMTSYGKISAIIDDDHIYCWDSGYAHHERVIKYIEESIGKPISDNAIWVRFKEPNLCWVSAAYFNEYTDDELEDLPQQDFEKDLETNPIIKKYFPKGVKVVRFDNLVESAKKEMSKLDKLIALHKKSPDEDISDLAREITNGNVEEYIALMKEYYKNFEK